MSIVLPTLVVDDDPHQRALVRTLFDRAGVGPLHEAVDAEDALRQATLHRPQLVLLDLEMPGRTGIEALPDLRAACPTASFVMLSNLPRRTYLDAALAAGAVGYVEKRVPAPQLVHEVLAAASLGAAAVERVTADFDLSVDTPSAARALVRDFLGDEHAELLDVVQVLVSEMVTNSIVHAASAPRVEVELRAGQVRVAVHDRDPTLPERRVPDLESPGGRGLLLLDRLATRWGAEVIDDGKVVWFELDR